MADKQAQLDNFNAQYPTRWNATCEYGIYVNPQGQEFVIIRTKQGTRFEPIK